MQLTGEKKNNVFVVNVKGRMDLDSIDTFNNTVEHYIKENETSIILNCRELAYINSSGLSSFIHLSQKLQELKLGLFLCELQKPVREVFDIAGLGSYFKIFTNEDEAFKNL